MTRSNEGSNHGIPQPPDSEAWRHWGDGLAGRMVGARIQGYDSSTLSYIDVAVDSSGVLQTSGGGGGGGSVTQGTSPWVTNDPGLPDTLGQKNMAGSTSVALASDQSALAVTGAFWQSTQPVSIASMPSTPVTGTFWQSTQPVSLASLPALAAGSAVIGHVIVDTAPTTAVTGTFWQATQPVSWASAQHIIVDTAPTTAVTGTFWQSTQPVSIASMPSTPVTGAFSSRDWVLSSGTDSVAISGSISNTSFAATQGTSPWVVSGAVTSTQLPTLGLAQKASALPVVAAADDNSLVLTEALLKGIALRLDFLNAAVYGSYSPPDQLTEG